MNNVQPLVRFSQAAFSFLSCPIPLSCRNGCIEHNNRDFFTDNVDRSRTNDNITYVKKDLREFYHKLFDKAHDEYNAKQTRSDRCTDDHYEHIRQGKKEKTVDLNEIEVGEVLNQNEHLLYSANSFEHLLALLEQRGYTVKHVKYTAVKPPYS